MKNVVRIKKLFVRRVSPLSVPSHIKVRTRPGRPLIRENSWRLDSRARALLNTVNLIGWTIWIALFGLVLTSLAWSAGVWYVRREWVEAEGIRGLARFIENDLPMGISFCLVFLLWAMVRAMVVHRSSALRHQAERMALNANPVLVSKALEPPEEVWRASRQAQCLLCHHDAHGGLSGVEPVVLTASPPQLKTGLKDRLASSAQVDGPSSARGQ